MLGVFSSKFCIIGRKLLNVTLSDAWMCLAYVWFRLTWTRRSVKNSAKLLLTRKQLVHRTLAILCCVTMRYLFFVVLLSLFCSMYLHSCFSFGVCFNNSAAHIRKFCVCFRAYMENWELSRYTQVFDGSAVLIRMLLNLSTDCLSNYIMVPHNICPLSCTEHCGHWRLEHRVNKTGLSRDALNVCRFTAPLDVAKDAILVAKEALTADRPSFEIGQCTGCWCFVVVNELVSVYDLFFTFDKHNPKEFNKKPSCR